LLAKGKNEFISDSYFKLLYRREDFYSYKSKEGELFQARIVGIKDSGELILETDRGVLKEFGFKEVSFY
jgi:BirA family biotin operon repressor/biotin-[acetyl-CoA-carboxylase] ligase